jgi:hypothetical protein
MKNWLTLIVLLSAPVVAQPMNFWQVLAEVHFENTVDNNGYNIERPVFSKYLKSFHGKKTRIKGYMIPIEETGGKGKFMLSSMPFNLCYFCGAAGPETVVEIETTQHPKFTTKQIIMEGTLFLNDKDPNHHIYILKSATIISSL